MNKEAIRLRNLLAIVGDDAKQALTDQLERLRGVYKKSRPVGTFGAFLVLRGAIVYNYDNDPENPAIITSIQTNGEHVAVDFGNGNIDYVHKNALSTDHLIDIVEQLEVITKFKQIELEPAD